MNTKDYVIYKLNNGHVLFDEESGYWFYAKSSNTTKQSTDKLNVPSDDEAIKIAEKFISTNKLFDGEIGNPVVSNVTTGGWGTPEQITAKTVYFYPSIEKYSVYGIYRIAITIGASGEISAIYKQANSVEKVSNVKLGLVCKFNKAVLFYQNGNRSKVNESKKGIVPFVIPGCYSAKPLQFLKETFH